MPQRIMSSIKDSFFKYCFLALLIRIIRRARFLITSDLINDLIRSDLVFNRPIFSILHSGKINIGIVLITTSSKVDFPDVSYRSIRRIHTNFKRVDMGRIIFHHMTVCIIKSIGNVYSSASSIQVSIPAGICIRQINFNYFLQFVQQFIPQCIVLRTRCKISIVILWLLERIRKLNNLCISRRYDGCPPACLFDAVGICICQRLTSIQRCFYNRSLDSGTSASGAGCFLFLAVQVFVCYIVFHRFACRRTCVIHKTVELLGRPSGNV